MVTETNSETDRSQSRPPVGRRGDRARVYAVAFIAAALLVATVALIVVNSDSVRLEWVFGSTDAPLALVILLAAIAGWLVGLATGHLVRRRLAKRR